jgi:F-type H+-transporting ATPase subunit a
VAAESGASGGLTEYIQHHLKHNMAADGAVNVDSWAMGLGLGLLFCFWFWSQARKATAGVPGKGQAFVEMVIEFVDGQVKDVFHGNRALIAPLALTIFMWVFFMNAMDLLPLDIVAYATYLIGGQEAADHTYWRLVPTADLNTTFAMSTVVFLLTIYYSIKAKGGWGFTKELFTAPFHAHGAGAKAALAVPNFALNLVEYLSKPVSLAMRLFGNMYGGELGDLRSRRAVQRRLGDLPHPDHPAAGLHLHGADRRLSGDGARAPLSVAAPADAGVPRVVFLTAVKKDIVKESRHE